MNYNYQVELISFPAGSLSRLLEQKIDLTQDFLLRGAEYYQVFMHFPSSGFKISSKKHKERLDTVEPSSYVGKPVRWLISKH